MRKLLVLACLVFSTPSFGQAVVLSACGTGTTATGFVVGQLHPLTMNPAGYLCVSSTTMTTQEAPPPPIDVQKRLQERRK